MHGILVRTKCTNYEAKYEIETNNIASVKGTTFSTNKFDKCIR